MNGAVFMITVAGEMSAARRDEFDDVETSIGPPVQPLIR